MCTSEQAQTQATTLREFRSNSAQATNIDCLNDTIKANSLQGATLASSVDCVDKCSLCEMSLSREAQTNVLSWPTPQTAGEQVSANVN